MFQTWHSYRFLDEKSTETLFNTIKSFLGGQNYDWAMALIIKRCGSCPYVVKIINFYDMLEGLNAS